ncbi:hypothetical protein [Aquimarina macrocephali]|uniref:hypothetical protein n=1 Tax=Aquimarina macrocephali TaxID=666563 RepID=UPI0004669738|nr:hypothetical protein [Aquimarina macrocephali]
MVPIQRRPNEECTETSRLYILGGKLDTLADNFYESAGVDAGLEVENLACFLEDSKWDVELTILQDTLRDDYPNLLLEWEGEKVMKLIQDKIDALPEPNLTDSEKAQRILEYAGRIDYSLSMNKYTGIDEIEKLKEEMKTLDLM